MLGVFEFELLSFCFLVQLLSFEFEQWEIPFGLGFNFFNSGRRIQWLMGEWWIDCLPIFSLFSQVVYSGSYRWYSALECLRPLDLPSFYLFVNVLFKQSHVFLSLLLCVSYLLLLFLFLIVYRLQIIRVRWVYPHPPGTFLLPLPLSFRHKPLNLHSFILINSWFVLFFYVNTVSTFLLNEYFFSELFFFILCFFIDHLL